MVNSLILLNPQPISIINYKVPALRPAVPNANRFSSRLERFESVVDREDSSAAISAPLLDLSIDMYSVASNFKYSDIITLRKPSLDLPRARIQLRIKVSHNIIHLAIA